MEHFSQTCSHKALYNQHDKDYIDILQSELIYRVWIYAGLKKKEKAHKLCSQFSCKADG